MSVSQPRCESQSSQSRCARTLQVCVKDWLYGYMMFHAQIICVRLCKTVEPPTADTKQAFSSSTEPCQRAKPVTRLPSMSKLQSVCAGNQNCGPRRQLHWKIKKKRSAGTTNPRLHSSGILLDETVNRPSLLRERTGDIRVLMQICSECHISTLSCITLERVHRTSTCNAWATA